MKIQDIPFLSAVELSGLIKRKEVSPVEAVEGYLGRIDHVNPKLNAYLTVCREEALQAAREAEVAIARGQYSGPFHGIPVALKDQIYTRGVRTTVGSPIFGDFVPDEDATVAAKLKGSGAILLGKLNLAEFATTGLSHAFDIARNPWDLERYTGGSSSGSGAATAAFLCAASLGEDTAGSVRWPASWCGLVGLRPSWGRVSRYGVAPGVWSMDAIGPICRTVEDCAMTLQAIAGHDPKDPYTWKAAPPEYRRALTGEIKGIKLGIAQEMLDSEAVESEVRDAVLAAAGVLADLGATVQEVSIPLTDHASTISRGLRIEAPIQYGNLVRHRLQDLSHDNRIAFLVGSILPAQAYYKAQKLRAMLRNDVLQALEKVDVLLCPTTGTAAQKVGPDPIIDSKEKAGRIPSLLAPAFSLAGIPALSICCGFTSQDLPIGLQIAGRPFDEETVLKVAHTYEQRTPWHNMRPPIA